MPNNFKIFGNVYVSKAGNDAWDGLTPDTPKRTVQAGLTLLSSGQTLVIGSGVYKEALSRSIAAATSFSIVADGYVQLAGSPTDSITFTSAPSSAANLTVRFVGIEFLNYYSITFNPLGTGVNVSGQFPTFINCVLKSNVTYSNAESNGGTVTFNNCLLLNMQVSSTSPTFFDKSILINSINSTNSSRITNSYIDSSSLIRLQSAITPALFNFNNIQGKIIMNTNGAVSGVNSNGVALTFTQHRIDYPTFNVNSISADPKFNNASVLNFTLQPNSPNISGSSDFISNIGGTEVAVYYSASSAEFTTNATSESLEFRGLYYGISGSAVSGSLTSGPMFLQWPRTKPMTSIQWAGAIDFNKSITASFVGNANVPAYTTFTSASGNQGANPDRLKIQMRFSTQQTQPSTDSEWDNNGYWTAGTYQLFEINQKPKIDYKGAGNGDPTYVETSAIGDLVPSWVQTRIILRNDYNQ